VAAALRSKSLEPIGVYTTESVMVAQARPTVTFSATQHHHCLATTKFWLQRHVCILLHNTKMAYSQTSYLLIAKPTS